MFYCLYGLLGIFSIDKNKTYNVENIELKSKIQSVLQNNYKEAINKIVPAIKELSQNEKEEVLEEKIASEHLFKKYLEVELANETVNPKNDNEENNKEESDVEVAQNENLEEAKTNIGTEVVTQNPIVANPTDIYGKVQIRNQTGYVLNEDILNPNIEVNASNIIIFHTHTCESYTPTEQNQYEASGTYRTIDLTHSVARVGDELTNYLSSYGYNVVHDKSFHDYPAYTGSYARSLKTVEALKQSNNADVIIDLHRDAIGSNSDYAPTIRIGEDYAAQLMFVIGTDGGGLWHPNWQQNLKFAVKVQQKAEELYPGLFKPIIVRNSRYNQHVSKAATIIEVGATGNTLEQCMSSMKYLSKVLNEVVK